jgi:putative salt-induced outer membrane protein YdiY
MYKRFILLILALTLICRATMADEVTLKNGDRLTGSISTLDDKKLVIKTAYAGEVAIARDAIAKIESDQPLFFELSDGQTLVGTVTTVGEKLEVQTRDAGKVAVTYPTIRTIRSQAEQTRYTAEIERYRDPGLLDLWNGYVDLGLSLTRGNADTTSFTLGANAVRATKRDRTSVYFTSLYAANKTSGISVTTANAVRGGLRYELNLSERSFVFGFGDAESDEFQKLDLRMVLGGGFGYYVKKTERSQFQLFGGGSLNKEYFTDNTKRTSGEALFGEGFNTKLSDRVLFSERFTLFPNLSETGQFRATFDSSLVTKLSKWLDWHVSLSDRYLSNPVDFAKKNDVLLTTGLRLSFNR